MNSRSESYYTYRCAHDRFWWWNFLHVLAAGSEPCESRGSCTGRDPGVGQSQRDGPAPSFQHRTTVVFQHFTNVVRYRQGDILFRATKPIFSMSPHLDNIQILALFLLVGWILLLIFGMV